nr:uncharacterized protein LOC128690729 [Cherax quadricarinatus]
MGDAGQNTASAPTTTDLHATDITERNSELPKSSNEAVNTKAEQNEAVGRTGDHDDAQSTCSSTSSTPSSTSSEATSSSSSEGGAQRAIHIEDSDKKYIVVEPTKPKTWLAAYKSLAPRTRQTVRTAAIAILSALALVAIFHLAKLAEHPVSENVVDVSAEEGKTQQQQQQQQAAAAAAWGGQDVLKTSGGKVFVPPGAGEDWRGGKEFAKAVAKTLAGKSCERLGPTAGRSPFTHPQRSC